MAAWRRAVIGKFQNNNAPTANNGAGASKYKRRVEAATEYAKTIDDFDH